MTICSTELALFSDRPVSENMHTSDHIKQCPEELERGVGLLYVVVCGAGVSLFASPGMSKS